jgi:L-alanine-DL-glutamate epimerase-like enolase superfamily enzyme
MWRTLTDDEALRPPERDVAITDVRTMGLEGNPKGGDDYYTWGIVKVETDAGEHGIGETYRGPEAMAVAETMGPQVVGENPLDPNRIAELLSGNYTGGGTVAQSAITAIETACWDRFFSPTLIRPLRSLVGCARNSNQGRSGTGFGTVSIRASTMGDPSMAVV